MIDLVVLLAFYILGFISGAVSIVVLTYFIGSRAVKKRKDELESNSKKKESVSSRIKRVRDLTNEQLDLQGAASGPQMNALHGKYKNGFIGRIKEIDDEKFNILKSIIADGFDPEITVIDSAGVVTTVKLSQFLADAGINKEPSTPQPPKSTKSKFTVHRGRKDDDGDGDGQTTH